MKTLLVAINAKYEHEGLAVWYLKADCRQHGIDALVRQYSINDSTQRIWSSILEERPDIVAFSCYIWNRVLVLNLISDLKKARPECVIIVGGPEVSYEGSEADFYSFGADFVIKGEGEGRFSSLLEALNEGGLASARADFDGHSRCREATDYISPFGPEYLERIRDRIAYIESSRGCPYRCSYCLSSESQSFALFPIDEVKADIEGLVNSGAKVIKFVDRSFGINEAHSLAIWEYIKRYAGRRVTFHFEINADRLTGAQMDSLMSLPAGLVQVEAGIQSVNIQTLSEVSRVMNVDKALENLKILTSRGNIHTHADLIAGLPYEDMASFIRSFNRVYDARPHNLQLGFLKLLHGTRIRREADRHGYKYRDYPPYEFIENSYMDSEDVLVLKGVEEVLDRAYNSGRLRLTLEYLLQYFTSPFELYKGFSSFLKERGLLYQPVSASRLFEMTMEFGQGIRTIDLLSLDSYLALDYACSLKNTVIPEFLSDSGVRDLDSRSLIEQRLEGGWKKEYRKRFLLLSGSFPVKNQEDFKEMGNRMLVDLENCDPITGRAYPQPI